MAINWFLLVLGISAAIMLLFRDWRVTMPALLVNYLALALFLAEQQFITPDLNLFGFMVSTLVVVKLLTGIAVTLILALTALTFSREYGLESLDEFGLSELRRAARAAQRQQTTQPFRWGDYVLPFWAGVLALLASLSLPRIYPIAPSEASDFAWYWLGLTGILTIATASDLLKIGLGLLLCASAIDLVYTAVVSTPGGSGLNVMPLGLLSVFNILLALAIAYLSGLLYGRLKTLELGELYRR
ncbi:MAG: hypothetical protein EI684_05165 [Candidatus Viridilinea halotolerans]|uniref:Uncharacterized protein n=1 Tax=Candidatus Viridilinea halotolerans TaxID=2491704 RepID=A0A426U5K8_9CHLR|nr:MAG: hypothetical protein EI684_05165 [Candidatus Viridilinea halotolerans]